MDPNATNPPDTPKCPYAQIAQLGQGELATQIFTLADSILNLMAILGKDVKRHPSFFKENEYYSEGLSAIPVEALGPLERCVGNVHNIFRSDMGLAIGSLLDESRLKPETQDMIHRFHRTCSEYRRLVLATADKHSVEPVMKRPHFIRLAPIIKNPVEEKLKGIVNEIKASELVRAETIPIRTKDGSLKDVPNEKELGLFLFCLKEAVKAQFDRNKSPELVGGSFISNQIGLISNIVKNWNEIVLADEVHSIHQQASIDILREIMAVKRELQMVCLAEGGASKVSDSVKASGVVAAKNFLKFAGCSPYPEQLETLAEFDQVYRWVMDKRQGSESHALSFPLDERGLASIETAIQKKKSTWIGVYSKSTMACDLLLTFIKEQRGLILGREDRIAGRG